MNRLLRRNAYLHHYSSVSDGSFDALSALNEAEESLSNLICAYEFFKNNEGGANNMEEHKPIIKIADWDRTIKHFHDFVFRRLIDTIIQIRYE